MIALNVREYLVLEYRLDFGPGYRVYFGRDGDMLVILLADGSEGRHRGHAGRRRGHRQDDPGARSCTASASRSWPSAGSHS